MTTEEAFQILNEAVITEPSIKSYNYISADDINEAIQQLMLELERKEATINSLKKTRNIKRVYVKNSASFAVANINYVKNRK